MTDPSMAVPALGLMAILGLRHGLDPDHVAVIDNIVFRAVETRPRLAPWSGTLFALGHSLSVATVAVGVSLTAGLFTMPAWVGNAVDLVVIALLLFVGATNLAALRRRRHYTPVGWRSGLVHSRLRASTSPVAILAVGIIFGLVFDTATQAAAWGAAATAAGGTVAALAIALAFAGGMIVADTLDSQIVARLLRVGSRSAARLGSYRRAVGWLVVSLSFGMALLGIAEMAGLRPDIDGTSFSTLGIALAAIVILALAGARRLTRTA